MRPLRSYGFAQIRRSVSTDLRIGWEADLRFYGFTEIRRCGFPVLWKAADPYIRGATRAELGVLEHHGR
ncbi:conserved protein of unknown function [Ectopseudomonas oleovorans]|uniref:Uncharacterized protein n=1 Tax=Ectopseudomonas oleovorans TaxID=301 RepID=A0A653AXY8_ECTOL|nr:conserved protein of unknown function [Pseudomonas oleovorans]